ncbi:sulfite exporter TauE/SafE family protein [Methanosarcina sp. KYL-1]|uniref:sulfite exporter TauE/SafE family protein n=1 Tax=Methanosarcina sp. KYL-1 TaxID=2602068 RepID=UPI00210195C6|nr:sulfite exporter TauE/SafE family protein [Methanosarcina sp. KYL-1]MCQ1536114.1 sulfite exporter TauE/SafE family protein [Methanosarcina sp. KYL-1]
MNPIEPFYIVILFLTGAFTGLVSGLLGVGGGFIMSPIQYWLFQEAGISPDLALRIAFGTSLFVILPNAISGTLKHQRHSAVLWKQAVLIGVSGSIASFGGAAVASYLPAAVLSKIFGVTVILGALKTYTTPAVRAENGISSSTLLYVGAGIVIGFFSGLVGIGGGVLGIPIMLIFLHFDMRKAVGTSAAVMIFTSFGGALGYVINGWGEPGLPPYSLGYVNLLNWLLLAGPGVLAARKGAQIAHVVNPEYLKHFFVFLMVYIGLKMMGVF